MEVTYYEDPACSWCWAFQPVATAFAFEFRHMIKVRHVMGGLRDRPAADKDFIVQQWKKAETLSGMPFEPAVWSKHALYTTFTACRAVKAAAILGEQGAARLLRRLHEAFFTEQIPIDDIGAILKLAGEVGLDEVALRENLANGRAEELFARDRAEADQAGFGFPTISIMDKSLEHPVVLQGAVDYTEILETLFGLDIAQRKRRRFKSSREDWSELFRVHPRLTFAEVHLVTGISQCDLDVRAEEIGIRKDGVFYEWQNVAHSRDAVTPPCASCSRGNGAASENGAAEPFLGESRPILMSKRQASAAQHQRSDREAPD